MATVKRTRFDEELSKAMADRLGLSHEQTLRDWSADGGSTDVLVKMTVFKIIPVDEYDELSRVAAARAREKGAGDE